MTKACSSDSPDHSDEREVFSANPGVTLEAQCRSGKFLKGARGAPFGNEAQMHVVPILGPGTSMW